MPSLNGSSHSAAHGLGAGLNQLLSRGQWALEKATGGGIARSNAVPFADFERHQLPQLRKETAAALAAMPGLRPAQQTATLERLMTTASQAYESVCNFQNDHADSLGRRSAALLKGPASRNNAPGANHKMWNKQDPKSPFMQAVGGQVQTLMDGLLKRVAREAGGSKLQRVVPEPAAPAVPLATMVEYAKTAHPDGAHGMPFVPPMQCSTAAMRLAKDQLVTCVMEKFTTPSPAQLTQEALALLAITAGAHGDVVDLVSKTNGDLTHLTLALTQIVEGMAKRVRENVDPWLGLDRGPAQQQGQEAAGRSGKRGAGPDTGCAVDLAASALARSLQASALSGPKGPVSTALWHASKQVEGLAEAQRAGGSRTPTPEGTQKMLEFETSKILQQAGGSADLTDLREVVSALQPLVDRRTMENLKLWGQCSETDFKEAEGMVRATVAALPGITAKGLHVYLPQPLRNANTAQLENPAAMGDLMTSLALAWGGGTGGGTGAAAIMAGFDKIPPLPTTNRANTASSAQGELGSGPVPLSANMMLGPRAAAAQMVLLAPSASGIKQHILDARTAAVTAALVQGALGPTASLTTPEEVLAQAEALKPASPLTPSGVALKALAHLQNEKMGQIAEKAAHCGARLLPCLLKSAGDVEGLQALQAFEGHSAKATTASAALAANQGTAEAVMACRLQLAVGLQDLDENSAAAKAAQAAFNSLPAVKNKAEAHSQQRIQQNHHQAQGDEALTTLTASLVAALPKNGAGQPVLEPFEKASLSAFLNVNAQGNRAAAGAIDAALNSAKEGRPGVIRSHLNATSVSDAQQVTAFLRFQKQELTGLAGALVLLKADVKAVKEGNFDQMKTKLSAFKDPSPEGGANARPTPATPSPRELAAVRDITLSLTGFDLHPPLGGNMRAARSAGAAPMPQPMQRPLPAPQPMPRPLPASAPPIPARGRAPAPPPMQAPAPPLTTARPGRGSEYQDIDDLEAPPERQGGAARAQAPASPLTTARPGRGSEYQDIDDLEAPPERQGGAARAQALAPLPSGPEPIYATLLPKNLRAPRNLPPSPPSPIPARKFSL